MEEFNAIYRILTALRACMKLDRPNVEMFSHQALGLQYVQWGHLMEMLQDAGYIKGLHIVEYADDTRTVDASNAQITLRGLEYLQDNTTMQKLYRAAKGMKDVIPGL